MHDEHSSEYFNKETRSHTSDVFNYLTFFAKLLINRGRQHDESKFSNKEKPFFMKYKKSLKEIKYGSYRYNLYLQKLSPALTHHYRNNDHHPEFNRANRERWAFMSDFDESYFINNFGEIRILIDPSLDNTGDNAQYIKPYLSPIGYLKVSLIRNEKFEEFFVHELVAKYFINKNTDTNFIMHMNDDLQDNYYKNLKWVKLNKSMYETYCGMLDICTDIVIICVEKDLITFTVDEMVSKLNNEVTRQDIYECLLGSHNNKNKLTFKSAILKTPEEKTDIRFMNLLNITEMLVDWMAAAKGGSDDKGVKLKINKNRFKYDSVLENIFINTMKVINVDYKYDKMNELLVDANINVRSIVYDWMSGRPIYIDRYKKQYSIDDWVAAQLVIEKLTSTK